MKILLKKYKAILFDLDGTLIDSLPWHVRAFHEILEERNIRIKREKLQAYMGKPTQIIFKELKNKHIIKENLSKLREDRRYHYFSLVGKRELLFPNTIQILKRLKKEYKIGLVTSSSNLIYKHSTPKELQDLFETTITIDNVKHGKPNSEPLIKAARQLKLNPKECAYVGDAIFDMQAAKKSGMFAIGITTGYTNAQQLKNAGANKVIKNLKELIKNR